jgi:hypothetical protein
MQIPWFGNSDVHDPVLHEEIQLVTDLMVAVTDHPGPMPGSELDRALGLGASTPSTATAHERAWARIAAVNSQNRMAPPAREASRRISSAMSIHCTLLATSRSHRD